MHPIGVDAVPFFASCDVAHLEQVGQFVERGFNFHDHPCDGSLLLIDFSDGTSRV